PTNAEFFLRRLQVRADFITVDEVVALGAAQLQSATLERNEACALVVVDMQNDFVHEQGVMRRLGYSPLTDEDAARVVDNNRRLAETIRSRGWPVIFARVGQRPDGLDRDTDDE